MIAPALKPNIKQGEYCDEACRSNFINKRKSIMSDNAVSLSLPVELYTMSRQFSTVFNGKIYVGAVDTDPTAESNRITVYQEGEDGTLTATEQPISINAGGYPVISGQVVKLVVTQDYSIAVYDQLDAQVFYFPRCSGPYVLNVYHDQTLTGTGTESDPLGVQLSADTGNQLQIRDDGLYTGLVGPGDLINLYVSSSGDDSAAGTRAAPLMTVGEALTRISAKGAPGSYTINLKAGESFELDKAYSLGSGTFSLLFIFYDDSTFGDERARYGWWPEADERLQRPSLTFDTYTDDNGVVVGTSLSALPKIERVTFEGVNLVVKTTNGVSRTSQFLICSEMYFYGCNIFIEGVMGVGSAGNVGTGSSNVYFHGTAGFVSNDLAPSVTNMTLVPEGETVTDPLGKGVDVVGRTSNIVSVLTPDTICNGGTYDKTTKSSFGWRTSWDIFADN
ncbi:hypothetical protein EHW64_19610 [Erwinia psidii]|nr:hypothetical protein [Erwinia psidii]